MKKKIAEHGTVRGVEEVPEEARKVFGTAHEIHHAGVNTTTPTETE